jgi:hypothetical protein
MGKRTSKYYWIQCKCPVGQKWEWYGRIVFKLTEARKELRTLQSEHPDRRYRIVRVTTTETRKVIR